MARILIVDDNAQNLYLMETILKSSGYKVIMAKNGMEALSSAYNNLPDIIVSDILMPVMDGFELCRKWKADEKLKQIPFIFYTATYTDPEDEKFALSLGAELFIIKPQVPEILARIISEVLEKTQKNLLRVGISPKKETETLQNYNKVLFRKLEKKVIQLEKEIASRKQAEETIQTALREKEALIKELYHRTYNNMQVISSMLNVQASYIKNEEIKSIFKALINRISSMAKVHQKLYKSKDLSRINLKEYIIEISDLLKQSYSDSAGRSKIILDLEDEKVSIDTAIPCGLILNELLTNALKYAYPEGKQGPINISLKRIKKDMLELRVSDNGVGFPQGFDLNLNRGMGLQIVFDIAESQLSGKVEFLTGNGISAIIQLNDKLYMINDDQEQARQAEK